MFIHKQIRMPASLPSLGRSVSYLSNTGWSVNEALIAELQRCGAANVDKGIQQLLQTLLGVTHAKHTCCHLVNCGTAPTPITLMTVTAGLQAVDHEGNAGCMVVPFNYDIRPGRQLQFEFTPMAVNRPVHLEAASFLLSTQHRWLVWLDLSHGLESEHGPIPQQQRKVLLSLLQGKSEKQVAAELGLNINTTHLYVKQLYRRFGVRNRASLMSLWLNPAQAMPAQGRAR